jgi:hypothetical protein
MMRGIVSALVVVVGASAGCAKMAPKAAKAVVKTEQSALKSAPKLG